MWRKLHVIVNRNSAGIPTVVATNAECCRCQQRSSAAASSLEAAHCAGVQPACLSSETVRHPILFPVKAVCDHGQQHGSLKQKMGSAFSLASLPKQHSAPPAARYLQARQRRSIQRQHTCKPLFTAPAPIVILLLRLTHRRRRQGSMRTPPSVQQLPSRQRPSMWPHFAR